MKGSELRQKYIKFFVDRGHQEIPSASLVPENDPTTLFTSAGMQPMVPYLLGTQQSSSDKLVNSQRCFRSQDIEEVGDNRHTTFFEMLGNWSFGDYFKEKQIPWMFEFLTKELNLNPQRLYVTAFVGDTKNNLPKDTESVEIWKKLFSEVGIEANDIELGSMEEAAQKGMQGGRIFYYTTAKNWWSRAGEPSNMPEGEPGGPDSEMFYEFENVEHDKKYGENCHPNCDCGRFIEIGNQVFMQYQKTANGFKELPNKNVDFGGGLERQLMAVNNQSDIFKNDLFEAVIKLLSQDAGQSYGENPKLDSTFRVIADHLKAATFLIKDGVLPGNKLQGYVLRRLIRRILVKCTLSKFGTTSILLDCIDKVIDIYKDTNYFDETDRAKIKQVIEEEINKFQKTLENGLKEIEKIEQINSKTAFDLYQSYGFPFEILQELFEDKGQTINKGEFDEAFKKHQELSRQTSNF